MIGADLFAFENVMGSQPKSYVPGYGTSDIAQARAAGALAYAPGFAGSVGDLRAYQEEVGVGQLGGFRKTRKSKKSRKSKKAKKSRKSKKSKKSRKSKHLRSRHQ